MRTAWPRPADLEIGDTADLEVGGTGLVRLRRLRMHAFCGARLNLQIDRVSLHC
jgi:hypothetical protein